MRDDMTRIADAFGGTRANILRLAVPTRVAKSKASCASAIAMPQEPRRANNGSPPSTRRYTASCNVNTATSICCMTRCKADVSNRSFDLLPGADHWRMLRGMDGGRGARSEQAGGAGAADHAGDRRHD